MKVLLLFPLLLVSCQTVDTAFEVNTPKPVKRVIEVKPDPDKPDTYVLVDYSAKTAKFYQGGQLKRSTGNVRMGHHISSVPRSHGTPVGTYTITKEPGHRYGKTTWRLSGAQGKRGILMHRKLGNKRYSRGCICPPSPFLQYVYRNTGRQITLVIER
jgi:hypothetical protein